MQTAGIVRHTVWSLSSWRICATVWRQYGAGMTDGDVVHQTKPLFYFYWRPVFGLAVAAESAKGTQPPPLSSHRVVMILHHRH